MVSGFLNRYFKRRLEEKIESRLCQERDELVEIFMGAKDDLVANNKLTIERTCEEIKKELRENINDKVENAICEKTKEYENNLKKRNEDCLNQLRKNADNYFGAVLTQYQLMIDEISKSINEIKSTIEKSNESYKNLENKIEEQKKSLKLEDIEKFLNYKTEIDSRLNEIKNIYEKKDKEHKDLINAYMEQQKRLESQIDSYLKEIEQMKKTE